MLQVWFAPQDHSASENLGKCLQKSALLFSIAPTELEVEEIHPPMYQAPVVGHLGFDFCGRRPATAQLGEIQVRQTREVLGLKNDIYATALLGHV